MRSTAAGSSRSCVTSTRRRSTSRFSSSFSVSTCVELLLQPLQPGQTLGLQDEHRHGHQREREHRDGQGALEKVLRTGHGGNDATRAP